MQTDQSTLAACRNRIREMTNRDEALCVAENLAFLDLSVGLREAITNQAAHTVGEIRSGHSAGLMERFLAEYGLNTDEGVALMCLAEAYLRTPDAATLDALISDKIGSGDWARHLGRAESSLVNASTWALMLTGKVFRRIPAEAEDLGTVMRDVVRRLGEPVARSAVGEAMKILGRQFVLGRDIAEALENSAGARAAGYLHSFDMLGEAARTERDAKRYFLAYSDAIAEIAKHAEARWPHDNPGISVKLSALHPRYETVNRVRVLDELVPRLTALALTAKAANIPFAIDAEEADRLDLSLDVIERTLANPDLKGWDGFGVVVQAYSKRAPAVIDWLATLCEVLGRRISVRLVKGAYWDAEIKNAQALGLDGYPVFTRKENTDLAYLACAKRLLSAGGRLFPQFATHNAHTVVAIEAMAPEGARFEFQRLHGMGEPLHEILRSKDGRRRRIYAPVGVHKDLLAYLVRRLLENGANSSFVHQILDKSIPAERITRDPVQAVMENAAPSHPNIPLPRAILPARRNSRGWNLNDPATLQALNPEMEKWRHHHWGFGEGSVSVNPWSGETVGSFRQSTKEDAQAAIAAAVAAFPAWSTRPADGRSGILERAADLLEVHHAELMALIAREAGKTRFDAVAEIREAVDFLRYYAAEARTALEGREPLGAMVCISPWNFPAAIFTGQIAGCLAAGNTVVAKPAEQTPMIAARLVQLFHEAGVPRDALALVQGEGAAIGSVLTGAREIAGVVFTGGTDTARLIDMSMASANPQAILIAETGGQNAMIVDSTALPEQAVRDIVSSAFQSAGQRCSALRVLFLQNDVAPQILEMLEGAARQLRIGDPLDPATDVGPVIDEEARAAILDHCQEMKARGRLLFELDLPEVPGAATVIAPSAFALDRIGQLEREIFGPVLHVIRYEAGELDRVVDEINATGYGLTLGIHSRIDARVDRICAGAHAGNIYVNRNQIGAVVGVQPFGGEGLSGTGPKAGGPLYLKRLTRALGKVQPPPHEMAMPGPTGERNTWSLVPRGMVACLGPGKQAMEAQRRLAISAGNRALTPSDTGGAPESLLSRDDIAMALWSGGDGEELARYRRLLSERGGRRVLVIDPALNPEMLHGEKVVSEDTTASGGNASLLASVG